ncbi:unnamed protein product [Camellia sinensis]
MEDGILLVCTHGQTSVLFRLHRGVTFAQIVDDICGKFDGLVPGVVCLLFDVPRYKRFKVVSDDDINNMLCLGKSFGLKHIEVIIQAPSGGVGGSCGLLDSTDDGGNYQDDIRISGVEDQSDLLPTYCPNRSKTFLSVQWAYGITHVGQCFDGGANEFREVLCKYAVERGFQFKYVKNDSVRITAVCKFAGQIGCMWSVHARMLPSTGVLCIKRFDSVHSCGAAVRTYRNPRTGSELVSTVVVDQVRDQPLTHPADVVFDLKKKYGLEISYHVAWLGVEKAMGEVYGDHAMSFDQLWWYSDSVMEKNPNSYINLEFEHQTGKFIRYFISFRVCIDGFNHCRPLLFLDGTFLKGRFKGNLFAATAKDGNQGLFPVAFAVVDSENAVNWEWFLRNLKQKVGLMRKLRECTYAPTVNCFNEKMEVLKKCSPAVIEGFMKDLDPKHWSNAYFKGQWYGEMCSNVAESFNNWVNDARHLPITRLVDMVRGQIMEQMAERRVKCNTWASILCPKMEKKLATAFNDSRPWCVSQANDEVYEVHSNPSVLVDVGRHTCSCFQWQINGFPCSHAVVAFRNSRRNIYDSIDRAFHIDTFRASYSGTIYPIPTVEKPNVNAAEYMIAPPTVKRSPGRPKRKKIPSKGEVVQRIRRGRCGKFSNHNRKTCKEPI